MGAEWVTAGSTLALAVVAVAALGFAMVQIRQASHLATEAQHHSITPFLTLQDLGMHEDFQSHAPIPEGARICAHDLVLTARGGSAVNGVYLFWSDVYKNLAEWKQWFGWPSVLPQNFTHLIPGVEQPIVVAWPDTLTSGRVALTLCVSFHNALGRRYIDVFDLLTREGCVIDVFARPRTDKLMEAVLSKAQST